MKRQNNIWYVKVEGNWLPLEDFPFTASTPVALSVLYSIRGLPLYAEWFLTLYKEIQEKSVFNHKLYRGGEPLKLLLEVQEMIQHLLDKGFP